MVQAMAYCVAKHAASFLPVLVTANDPAPVDALVLAGGLARGELLIAKTDPPAFALVPDGSGAGSGQHLVMAPSVAAALEGKTPVQECFG